MVALRPSHARAILVRRCRPPHVICATIHDQAQGDCSSPASVPSARTRGSPSLNPIHCIATATLSTHASRRSESRHGSTVAVTTSERGAHQA